jgi:NTP pyrophosphatase (non-canonical NTP hydrolase)
MAEDPKQMSFDEYQEFTSTTSTFKDTVKADCVCPECGHKFTNERLEFFGHALYTVLGLVGEVGELAEKLKKHIRNGRDLQELKEDGLVAKEFGDIAWYLAASTRMFGFKLSKVIQINKLKINSRKSRGVLHGKGDER